MTKEKIFSIAYEESKQLYNGIIDKDSAIRNLVIAGWPETNAKMAMQLIIML